MDSQDNLSPQPLVSVLMTSYNREKYIGEAIDSVLASSYTNWELIIVDDQSTDNTVHIAQGYAARDTRIKVWVNEVNLKDYPNRNNAATYATGKYIKYVDSDDLIYPWGLEIMVYCMERYPEAGYGLVSYGLKRDKPFPVLLPPRSAYYSFIFEGSMIITGPTGSIFRRDVFEASGGFSGRPYIGDMEMWLKLSQNYSLVAMPLDVVWWRQHDEQQFKEGHTSNYYEENNFKAYIDALENPACPLTGIYKTNALRNVKNRFSRNILKYALKGKLGKARHLYKIYGLGLADLLASIKFNKYPPKI